MSETASPAFDTPASVTPAAEQAAPAPASGTPSPEAPATAKKPKKKGWIVAAAVVAVLAIACVICVVIANGSGITAPLKTNEKYRNAKTVKLEDYMGDFFNGSDGGKASEFIKLAKKIDFMSDRFEQQEDMWTQSYDDNCKVYGKNFKYSQSFDHKEKLSTDEVGNFRNSIREYGEAFAELAEELEDLKRSDLREIAEDLDISVSDVKKIISCIKTLGDKFSDADVSKGYRLYVDYKITGNKIDEPQTGTGGDIVYKVNGKWVSMKTYAYLRTVELWAEQIFE